jgi:hypothetical protein
MLDQQFPVECQKGLIGAHAGASAASQHESGHLRMHGVYLTAWCSLFHRKGRKGRNGKQNLPQISQINA